MATGPLRGMKVIDLTVGDSGPFIGMQMGDGGADVIKVEPITGDWARPLGGPGLFDHGDGPLFMGMNRNKRSIALDLETTEGKAIVHALLKDADVLIHNFPKAADAKRLGLDYESLEKENPRLVYCDFSMVGRVGPEADGPETDLTLQARVGLPRFLGERGAPPNKFGSNYAGVSSAMYAMQAILAALFWRNHSGQGQAVHTSVLSGMLATEQNYLTSSSDPDGDIRGFPVSHLEPPSQGLETAGQRVEMGFNYARDPEAIDKLFDWLGVLEKVRADHPEVASRHLGNQDTQMLRPYLLPALKTKTYPEVYDKMMELGIQWAPVHDYGSMYAYPGILEQDVVRTVEHPVRGTVKEVSPSWAIDEAPAEIRLAPPLLGEHTDVILGEIGYDAAKIAALRASNVVK